MTAQQMIDEVFRMAGKPSNLQIYTTPASETGFDITLAGSQRILRYVNEALTRIANWKFRDGGQLRFRELFSRLRFQALAPIELTATAGTLETITVPVLGTDVSGEFDGWIVEIETGTGAGEKRLVVSSVVSGGDVVLTVNSPYGTAPDTTSEVLLYKSFFKFIPSGGTYTYLGYHIALDPVQRLGDILKIRDITSLSDLSLAEHLEMMTGSLLEGGVPTQYRIFGNELWLDVAPIEKRAYEILYVKNPTLLTAATDVPELPEIYHEAAVLWALHNVQRLYQDLDGAYATKRELEDLMAQLRMQGSMSNDYEQLGLTIWG